jgi:hypothetical protein
LEVSLTALESRLLKQIDEQTRTLVLAFIGTNAALVLAVALLAFLAVRFA